MRRGPRQGLRAAVIVSRAGWGLALIAVPQRVLRAIGAPDSNLGPRNVVRVLGVRHLAQAATEARGGTTTWALGIIADVLHAATGVGLASVSRAWRQAALTDATIATAFTLSGAACRPETLPRHPGEPNTE